MIPLAFVASVLAHRSKWPDGCVSSDGRVPCRACGAPQAKWCNHTFTQTPGHLALCDECLTTYAAFFGLDTLVNGPV